LKRVLVLCNHVEIEPALSALEFDEKFLVNPSSPHQNLNLHLNSLIHRILEGFNPLAHDLLEIAAYIYYADCSIRRGEIDVFAQRWKRKFDFIIPVSDPELWNRPDIKESLIETLDFLTGDQFSFHFMPPKPRGQLFLDFGNNPFPGADCITLFSGGLDSLVGALFLKKVLNLNPLLVSHRSIATTDARQKELVRLIRERTPETQFPHLSIWINRMGKPASEETQRSRAFLYLSAAAAVATQLDISKIFICENGIVSINIPISGQNIGTMLTRSTHPRFIKLFEQLIKALFTKDLVIKNPFIFFTKTQVLELLKDWGQADLIQATISCSSPHRRTLLQPQCGTCSQCVGRRFSVISAGLEEFDRPEFYEKDIFLTRLTKEGKQLLPKVMFVVLLK
jgi:7-cyano-7-deazaguanine synthase in queuosine biosynthesis